MTLLSRFLKLLEWLETAQDFFHFIHQPVGLFAAAALCFYFPVQQWGCDSLSAATLSCTIALAVFCVVERPRF